MHTADTGSRIRQVAGTIDHGDVYTSAVAAGGGFAFFAGTAVDGSGAIAAEARPPRPYRTSEAAKARREAEYIYARWKKLLPEVGSSIDQALQVEQYVRLKAHADGYFAETLRDDLLGTGTSGGATAQIGRYHPLDAAVCVTGVALVPDPAAGHTKHFPGVAGSPTGKFADVVQAGPLLFTTVYAMDRKAEGMPAAATVPLWSWNESEIRTETEWAVEQLARKLAANGAGLGDVVNYTVMMADLGDLYEFDLVMRKALGEAAPSRTVIPMRGSAVPRREGAFGHLEGAPRIELQFRALAPGAGHERTIVGPPGATTGYQSAGVQVGSLLWLSSQSASDPMLGGGTRAEIEDILRHLAETCASAGTDLRHLLRLRALVRDTAAAGELANALRAAVPDEPPTVCVLVVDDLPVDGATVALDGVAVVPGR
jgi:enamine deaminase RidA (YjgF/YER057c/UK114 family)